MSLRDRIREADDIVKEPIEVPEWDCTVEVRSMSGAERTRIFDLAMVDGDRLNLQTVYPEVVISSAFDPETGEKVFEPSDRAWLVEKNAVALDRLAQVGLRLGGFTQESADAVGKDSSSTPDDGSSSD